MRKMFEQSGVEEQLVRDCRVLFGTGPHITPGFLAYLQISGLKSAYRQRARETHPDLLAVHDAAGRSERSDDFIAVRRAFENLSRFIERREALPSGSTLPSDPGQSRPFGAPERRHSGRFTPRSWFGSGDAGPAASPLHEAEQHLYRGGIPDRRLLLGHFLYYAGLASWPAIVQALIWQRSSRPRLGELALRQGWLTDDHVRAVLDQRDLLHPFGQSAVAMALLSEKQRRHLLAQQRRLQKKIGRFFVESGRLAPEQFARILVRFHLHNAAVKK